MGKEQREETGKSQEAQSSCSGGWCSSRWGVAQCRSQDDPALSGRVRAEQTPLQPGEVHQPGFRTVLINVLHLNTAIPAVMEQYKAALLMY